MSIDVLVRHESSQEATFTFDGGTITATPNAAWLQDLLEYLRGSNHRLPTLVFIEWNEQRDKFNGEDAGTVTPALVDRELANDGEFFDALETTARSDHSDYGIIEVKLLGTDALP